jgi:Catalase
MLEGEQQEHTQDFLMINNPVFFIRDVEEYAVLTRYQAAGSQFGYFFQGFNPLHWKLREFRIGVGILKWPPRNLLGTQFHSMSAYRLGPGNFVKYTAKPVACNAQASEPRDWWASGGRTALGNDLTAQIQKGPACFDFMVQVQAANTNMPVEDTTVLWREKDSPFVTVARLELPQNKDGVRQDSFCENLSFTPWHTLPDHEPAGGLNRLRKAVYQGISRYRRCMNGIAFGEPREDGTPVFDSKTCNPQAPVPTVTSSQGIPPG